MRCTRGSISLSSSKRLEAVSSNKSVTPVALSPGRARLLANPSCTGSALLTKTSGVDGATGDIGAISLVSRTKEQGGNAMLQKAKRGELRERDGPANIVNITK